MYHNANTKHECDGFESAAIVSIELKSPLMVKYHPHSFSIFVQCNHLYPAMHVPLPLYPHFSMYPGI